MPVVNTLSASLDGSATQLVPTGAILSYAGSSAPAGWLVCDGAAVSRTTYANLFSALGTTFGTGDGSTTFNLPDLRGRFIRYDDNMGSHGISGVTSTGAASRDTSRAHGSAQGQATAKNGLAATTSGTDGTHSHAVTDPGHSHSVPVSGGTNWSAGTQVRYIQPNYEVVTGGTATTGITVTSTSSGHGHTITVAGDTETRPINIALNAIIKI